MPAWTLVDTHPTRGRTLQRPLDPSELDFLWKGIFDGNTDVSHHFELRFINRSRDLHLFSNANIVQAWLSTKRRYPLSAATFRCADVPFGVHLKELEAANNPIPGSAHTAQVHFVVQEHDLFVLHPNEIVFEQVACLEEVEKRASAISHGPRQLSDQLLARLYVFRETERSDVLHFITVMSHSVMDAMGNLAFARCLLDTLTRGMASEPIQIPLEERLALAISPLDLEPVHLRSLSLAKRRWRRAVATLILRLRMRRNLGGHTLPCRFTLYSTAASPSQTRLAYTLLTQKETSVVLSNCRSNKITFGNAYLVLAQVAMTRVLYRRYLRGEISEEEWNYRKRQPHINIGPLNLRPYLDRAWFESGGGGEFMNGVSCYLYQLPFMTLGKNNSQRALSDGAPSFSDLLTFDRFLHRSNLVKEQAAAYLAHPLFFEIVIATRNADVMRSQLMALEWMKRPKAGDNLSGTQEGSVKKEPPSIKDRPVVFAHTGSSLGNMDLVIPSEYPLPPSYPLSPYSPLPHPAKAGYVVPPSPSSSIPEAATTPKLVVENWTSHYRTNPGGRYLGASTWRGQMKMFLHYDSNLYEEEVIKEWLDELKAAVLWYLGTVNDKSSEPRASSNRPLRAAL